MQPFAVEISGEPPIASTALVRVIIPAYNAERFIAATLASVIAQSQPSWRCVVVDDGSADGTAALVSAIKDPRVELVQQSNAGVSTARNQGLLSASEPYALFLDADDVLHPAALERLTSALSTSPKSVAAFGTMRKIFADGTPYPGQPPLCAANYPSGDVLTSMLGHNFLANGGQILVRTDVAKRVGGFLTHLKLSEDWEFWCRLAAAGEFLLIDKSPEVFSLRMSDASVTRSAASVWSNYLPAFNAVFSNTALQARYSTRAWRKIRARAWAEQRWEFGRVSFTQRAYAAAFHAMRESLLGYAPPKRLVLASLAVLSAVTGRSFASRFRFAEEDVRLGPPKHVQNEAELPSR